MNIDTLNMLNDRKKNIWTDFTLQFKFRFSHIGLYSLFGNIHPFPFNRLFDRDEIFYKDKIKKGIQQISHHISHSLSPIIFIQSLLFKSIFLSPVLSNEKWVCCAIDTQIHFGFNIQRTPTNMCANKVCPYPYARKTKLKYRKRKREKEKKKATKQWYNKATNKKDNRQEKKKEVRITLKAPWDQTMYGISWKWRYSK